MEDKKRKKLPGVPIQVISLVIVGRTVEIPKSAILHSQLEFTSKLSDLRSRCINFFLCK